VPDRVYASMAQSAGGGISARRGLDALFDDMCKGKVERIVVYKLDRLGRSLAHLAQLIAELTANGPALICTNQGIRCKTKLC
jgi:DNA invertase Pin-like site-specific DNA recombinase